MRRKLTPVKYPEGFFTALMREHDWPPKFVCSLDVNTPRKARFVPNLATREYQSAAGVGWGDGTVLMPGTPMTRRPGWLP